MACIYYADVWISKSSVSAELVSQVALQTYIFDIMDRLSKISHVEKWNQSKEVTGSVWAFQATFNCVHIPH